MTQWHVERFYETLAKLISEKYGVDVKVKVTPKQETEKKCS